MPYRQQIADLAHAIAEIHRQLDFLRSEAKQDTVAIEKALMKLAKLGHERVRLMLHQADFDKEKAVSSIDFIDPKTPA
jgi:hypothetical protein